jgi:glycosyltransferase involved in cell wall biosynthesis
MKILNVVFDDRYGGPQKRVIEVASRLREVGVETVLCVPNRNGNAPSAAREQGVCCRCIDLQRIPRPNHLGRLIRWTLGAPAEVWRLVKLFREERPDVIHVNGGFFLTPGVAAKCCGIPLVWHLNDVLLPSWGAKIVGAVVQAFADVVVVSAHAVAAHHGVPAGKYQVLYPPVDVTVFNERRPDELTRPCVGMVANWNPLKGHPDFIRAIAQVREAIGDGIRVTLAGAKLETHAAYRANVEALIEELGLGDTIEDLGFISKAEEVIPHFTLLVQSSISEACGMSGLEAMAAGVPVVATDVGGVEEILGASSPAPGGLIVPVRDPVALAEAILQLLRDPELRVELGRNGRARAERIFSSARCAERHLEVYSSVVRGVRSPRRAAEHPHPDPTVLPRT